MNDNKALEPSRKILSLLNQRIRPPLIWDRLREIRAEVIALEIQVNNLMVENQRLVHEANKDRVEVEIPF